MNVQGATTAMLNADFLIVSLFDEGAICPYWSDRHSTFLESTGLTYEKHVMPKVRDRFLSVKSVKWFLGEIERREPKLPTASDCRGWRIEDAKQWQKYILNQRRELIEFLNAAIQRHEQVFCKFHHDPPRRPPPDDEEQEVPF